MGDAFLGIDIGTSSIRAILFDGDGQILAKSSVSCHLSTSLTGGAELDAESVLQQLVAVIQQVIENFSGNICCMSFSCHMHSVMAIDKHGHALTPVFTWADTRCQEQAEFIGKQFDVASWYKTTGCRLDHPMYPLSKILWWKQQSPEIFAAAYKFVTIKEYILFHMYNEFVVDYTLAASQGFFDIHSKDWNHEILQQVLGITSQALSTPVDCLHILKNLQPQYRRQWGISCDIPAVVGTGDGIAANLGCGNCDTNYITSTIGTSGALRVAHNQPLLSSKRQTWCYNATENHWVSGGAINNGGIVLKWLEENIIAPLNPHQENIYQTLNHFAQQVTPGSEGVIFWPNLMGERSPDWNAISRGSIHGLSYNHNIGHIIRAAMEGVMYRMYWVYQIMRELLQESPDIIACGGYTQSPVWLQMQADIFEKKIYISEVSEASALGAAFLGMIALGKRQSIHDILAIMKPQQCIVPIAENSEIYRVRYHQAKEIYHKIYG